LLPAFGRPTTGHFSPDARACFIGTVTDVRMSFCRIIALRNMTATALFPVYLMFDYFLMYRRDVCHLAFRLYDPTDR
jgi:hypothetical protein